MTSLETEAEVADRRVRERAVEERLLEHHEEGIVRDVPEIEATRCMCSYCFELLEAHFKQDEPPTPTFPTDYSCPLFVTWEKRSRQDGASASLRGCIGTLSPCLISEIKSYAFASALRDTRFPPIKSKELPSLTVAVSLLVKYEPANGPYDWEVGMRKNERERKQTCHYLHTTAPDLSKPSPVCLVATPLTFLLPADSTCLLARDTGWTQQEAVESLVRKAGYKGAIKPTLLEGMTVTRYQSSKCKLTYQEYLALSAVEV
ncbi:unnamed protein product [Chrysoparadoxa australica]